MSDDETPEPATEPVKVKQVAIAAGIVTAALTAAVAFTVAGPLGVGVAAAGVAGTGYAAHRIRHPRTGKTWLDSWLTRTRKTTTKTGTLSWPFTGNQQKRALTRAGRASGQSSRSKLPSLTSTRAKRSAMLSGTRPGSRSGRLLPSTTAASGRKFSTGRIGSISPAKRSAVRSGSLTGSNLGRKPSTPTKTPAKPSAARPLIRRPSALSTNRRGSSALTGGTGTRKPLQLTNSRSRHRPTATRRSGGLPKTSGSTPKTSSRHPSRKRSGGGAGIRRFGVGTTRGRSSTTARRGRWNPWLSTRGGQTLGKRSMDTRRTRRAGRIGNPFGASARPGLLGRLSRDHGRDRTPNRTRLRPRPYARKTVPQLLGTGLRVPKRQRGTYGSRRGWRPFVRPSKGQSARARRTLRLRGGIWLRRSALWIAKTPARRWDRLWERLPKAPLPLTHYTERAGMKVPSGPKTSATTPDPTPTPPLATVTPIVRNMIPINQNGSVIYVSSPNDMIREAFQQLAQFHPGSALEVEQWNADLADTLNDVGRSFGVLADQMRDGMPFAAPYADSVREIGVAIAATAGLAQSAHATMRAAHEADFNRIENPRPDEGMWDPGVNR